MNSNETIKQAVMANMGVAFISEHTIGLEVAAGQLCVLEGAGPAWATPTGTWCISKAKRLSPAAAAFKAFMLKEGSELLKLWPQG